jgi:hypothetical protein
MDMMADRNEVRIEIRQAGSNKDGFAILDFATWS